MKLINFFKSIRKKDIPIFLKSEEYFVGRSIMYKKQTATQIIIKAFQNKSYCIIDSIVNNDVVIWNSKRNGSPKNKTSFYINKK